MRHLLSTGDLSRDEATLILDTAAELAQVGDRSVKKLPTLRGRTVVNLFYEDSTRTRTSFELAAKRLSADVINFSAKGSSVSKGESLKDTALTLQAMGADAVVIRHSASGAAHRLANWVDGSVLNAGDGTHEHPTQALLDAYTMRDRLGRLEGLRVAVVGDILHSRVARSNVLLLTTLGAHVTLVAPPTLLPVSVNTWPCEVSYDLDDVLPEGDSHVQEERRLFYVAVTRAKQHLYLTYPVNVYDKSTGMILSKPSRFLDHVSPSHLDVVALIEEGEAREWD